MPQPDALSAGDRLLSRYEPTPALPPLSLEVALRISTKDMNSGNQALSVAVALYVLSGGKRYIARNVAKFLSAIVEGRTQDFSRHFSLSGNIERFPPPQRRLIMVLNDVRSALENAGESLSTCRALTIPPAFVADIMRPLCAMAYMLDIDGNKCPQQGVCMDQLPIRLRFDLRGHSLRLQAYAPDMLMMLDASGEFLLCGKHVYRLNTQSREALFPLIEQLARGVRDFAFSPRATSRVVSELMPTLALAIPVEHGYSLNEKLTTAPLRAKVYLDRASEGISARVELMYEGYVFDPFSAQTPIEDAAFIQRDARSERAIMDVFSRHAFTVRPGMVTLRGQDEILSFIQGGIPALSALCEVYFSREFEGVRPRPLQLKARARVSDDQLMLQFFDDDAPLNQADVMAILTAIEQQKRYLRFKDGRLFTLLNSQSFVDFAMHFRDFAHFTPDGTALLPQHCALYMEEVLIENADCAPDDALRAFLHAPFAHIVTPPVDVNATLRHYQVDGYEWQSALHQCHLGGILADDMGLGKTIQAIALLSSLYPRGETNSPPSLVVVPSTLLFNWLSEFERFAPHLRVSMIIGPRAQREKRLALLKGEADIALTSYPLLRRDGDLNANIRWQTIILDEAQNIKNAQSIAAINARKCVAQSRFALTGTPLENHADELHSIFSFVLPGFLPPLPAFTRQISHDGGLDALKQRMRLFLLRRLKCDVLKELPEKIEQRMLISPTPEQKRVYTAVQARLRRDIRELLKERGFERGRMDVLSALMQLRQVCCHPKICLTDYQDGSGKLNMLVETLPDMIAAGHRVLIFSQFVSMLHILRDTLTAAGIDCLYLDGSTPIRERLPLCDAFNAGEGDVFLISLRAGGSGLNLTGADVVIHYDPWWNPAAEDQATDRAHRINQTRSVQVLKLILAGTIEESVWTLSQKKRELFDALITPGGASFARITADELLSLLDSPTSDIYL